MSQRVLDTIKLDKSIPIPLYYQLKKQLLSLIRDASIGEGELLPPEFELCERLNVSRPTIRQAFSELVNEGYLTRHKGKGTFVSKPKVMDQFFSKLETFHDEMAEKGFNPATVVLKLEKILGPHEANEKLSIPLNAPLIYLSRVRSVNSVPLVYLETFLPYETCGKLMLVDFKVNSLYDSLEKIHGLRINRVRREFMAVNARQKEAELLQIARNKAISLVKTVAYSADTPVEFSVARYRGDINQFSVELAR
ncbi:MAG: GntR family transcriptional regulator [Treponema sp.]|jgi:GntR family transcriptional regulator|nr:GntR family transcriptional regulator [Treponema sp.]